MATQQAPLTVYKASAGSGKTFTLAVEYIKLLVADPTNYRYTLAVTFTNKATEEMKTRILGQLYGIANSLEDSEPYMKKMRVAFPTMLDGAIRERAQQALQLILHHYHYFRVETIDSFFQSILRNLARELELTANLQIGLNDKEVEAEAVDNIIERIDKDNDQLLGWIMAFVEEKISEDKSWNVIKQIKDFGLNIFKDFYKAHQEELEKIMAQPDFFQNYKSMLHAMQAKAEKEMAALAKEYEDIATENGLEDSHFFQGKKNAPGYFAKLASGKFNDVKMPNSYIQKGLENAEELVKKADRNTPEGQAIISRVGPLLRRAEEARLKAVNTINSVTLTQGNLNELRLLGRIEQEVKAINATNNNFLLSDTQKLLSDLIDKQDAPFIYEKIGGQLRYVMIDEFQDTSTVQWANFKVLLDDCLAHNNGSLIVGDVKQSIYRWRSGDWKLLQGLTPEADKRVTIKPLDTNYRSKRHIIYFNNAFFKTGAEVTSQAAIANIAGSDNVSALKAEAESIAQAYADVRQLVSPKRLAEVDEQAGSVTVKLLPDTDYDDKMVEEVTHTLQHLLSEGIAPRKIAILVRYNKEIQHLANYFQQNAIEVNGKPMMVPMVSDEAFRLDASLAVNTIVRAMHLLAHPDDRLTMAALAKAYRRINGGDEPVADSTLYVDREDLWELLPEEMASRQSELLATPLIDLAERLYKIFNLSHMEGQSAYVCAFFDQLSAFMQKRMGGIEEFVEEWDNSISGKSIRSDEVNGVRLLTIHKSKGLEFDNVIIPYCDWKVEKDNSVLWFAPSVAPYNALPLAPVKLKAGTLKASIYSYDYQSEHIKNLVDNLNTIYVAFTRAGSNLFVFGKQDKKLYLSVLMNKVMGKMIEDRPLDAEAKKALVNGIPGEEWPTFSKEESEDDVVTYQYGTLCPTENKAQHQTANVFEQKEEGLKIDIRNYEVKAIFRQSNDSKVFTMAEDALEEQEREQQLIGTGNILHALLANIRTADDIDRAIDELEFDGVLYNKPMTRAGLKQMIVDRLAKSEVARWFAPGWQVYNESAILTYDEGKGYVNSRRPDRVITNGTETIVIDYKTGKPREGYDEQVRDYMDMLRGMGHENVKGYLWYIHTNEVVRVV